jgi:Pentapeptide repeats (9 copies)
MTLWHWAAAAGAVTVLVAIALTLRRQSVRQSMTMSILGWLLVAALVGVTSGSLLLWILGWPRMPRSSAFTTTETLDVLKIGLAVVAGFGGVVVLSVNHRKQRFTEKDHQLALEKDKREGTQSLNERFAAAAEQLAHERAQVRLAGVYAMASLADDWDDGRQKCVDVLIAYLRLSNVERRTADPSEAEVVDTIFRVFRDHLVGYTGWCHLDFDFTGMKLTDVDFGSFTFLGTVTLDDVVFSGERTSFADASFGGTTRCRGTEFTAEMTTFRGASFSGLAEFRDVRFGGPLDMEDSWWSDGDVRFVDCVFEGPVNAQGLIVKRGSVHFGRCLFDNAPVSFRYAEFGDLIDPRRWFDPVLGRKRDPARGRLRIIRCQAIESPLTMDDVYMLHGRVVIHDLLLRGGLLRIKPAEMRHSSLDLRRIDREDAEVDVPLPARYWAKERAAEPDGTPPPVST